MCVCVCVCVTSLILRQSLLPYAESSIVFSNSWLKEQFSCLLSLSLPFFCFILIFECKGAMVKLPKFFLIFFSSFFFCTQSLLLRFIYLSLSYLIFFVICFFFYSGSVDSDQAFFCCAYCLFDLISSSLLIKLPSASPNLPSQFLLVFFVSLVLVF